MVKYDVIVVGGGVLGTFHAYHAHKAGLKVALLEKSKVLQGATVRNFGQVVPSGMNSKWQKYGRESLAIYKEIQSEFDISVRQEGSVYIASNDEEVQLLHELQQINIQNNYTSELFSKEQLLKQYPGTHNSYAKEGLFFPEEVIVEPREMIHKLHQYMQRVGITISYGKKVIRCDKKGEEVNVSLADGTETSAKKVIICNGSDFETLFPEYFVKSDLEVVKLQMMATVPQPSSYKIPGAILTGLTIRRYEAFSECPSYSKVKARESEQSFEKKWDIHILFKQAKDGSVIIGDSHEYAPVINRDLLGFDLNMDIDRFIKEEAEKIIQLPKTKISQRWYGIYSQSKSNDIYQKTIDKDIHVVTGIGGKGMTGSAGFSKENIKNIFNL